MQTTEGPVAPNYRLGDRWRLGIASFLMLFVELTLIRWSAAHVVYVAYFTNFVLLSSFLGVGVGFLRAGRARDVSAWAPAALVGLVAYVRVFSVEWVRNSQGDLAGLWGMPALPIWISLPVLFLGVTAVMACIAEGVARIFVRFEPLEAYRLDVVGSITGIVAFSGLAFLRTGPLVWGVVIVAAFAFLSPRRVPAVGWVPAVLLLGVFAVASFSAGDTWSPYYRVTVYPPADGRIDVMVNGLPHQSILPLAKLKTDDPFYLAPYTHLTSTPQDVLVVGAGNGNDVAVALSKGVGHVDAVEIDPVLLGNGELRHPERPYQNVRVSAHVDDGRAFLERTHARYDLILFALPDSLTLVTGQGSLRLESYLFTEEAMQTVRDHLKPGGVFSMYNFYRPFIFERYARTMTEVFGQAPCFDAGKLAFGAQHQSVLTVGREPGDVVCAKTYVAPSSAPAPATDDRPFPYVKPGTVPMFYVWALLAIVLVSIVVIRLASGEPISAMRGYGDLFAMGAAFLLLETKSVVQFALLFGTTWLVNSLVFGGILLAVLAAVEVTRRFTLPRRDLLFGALLVALVVAWFVPPSALLSLAPVPRFVGGVALAFAPVFLANLIFAQRFRDVGASAVAFGANLLGAMLGGVLEYLAIATGYRFLLVVVAILYGVAYLLGRGHLSPQAMEIGPPERASVGA